MGTSAACVAEQPTRPDSAKPAYVAGSSFLSRPTPRSPRFPKGVAAPRAPDATKGARPRIS
jgi:hypothetical protein